jgi:hypothetical protein
MAVGYLNSLKQQQHVHAKYLSMSLQIVSWGLIPAEMQEGTPSVEL